MSDDSIAPIIVFIVIGMPIAYLMLNRALAHRERIEMIRQGTMPPDGFFRGRGGFRMGAGPGCGCDPYPYSQYGVQRQLRKGISTAMLGLALCVGLTFVGDGRPGPWMLGGLIPLFVGLSQIIIAVLSGAHLGPFEFIRPGMPPPPPPPAGDRMGPHAPPESHGWRPGSTIGLESPLRPPDVK